MPVSATEYAHPGYALSVALANIDLSAISALPSDWQVVRLADVLDLRNGVNAEKHSYGHGVQFINVLEVITNSHLFARSIPGRVNLPRRLVQSYAVQFGDLVFNRTSETQEEVGLAAVYLDDEVVVFGGFVIRGRFREQPFDPIYSGYALRAPAVRSQIIAKGQGAIRANIGQMELGQVELPIPRMAEQRAIAAALSDVDSLIAALNALIAKKRAIKQAAMQQLLTGSTRLPGFVGEWQSKSVAELFTFLPTANNPRADLSSDGAVGYIHYGDIHTNTRTSLDCSVAQLPMISETKISSTARVRDGDLVVVDASEDEAGIGKSVELVGVGERQIVAGLHTFLLRGDRTQIVDGFKQYLQFLPSYRAAMTRLATGISVFGVSKANVASVVVEIPCLLEQQAIAQVLSDMDAEIEALEARVAKTRDIKQGMMQQLLTGRIRLVSPAPEEVPA